MKKIFILLTSVFLALCIAACGTAQPQESAPISAPEATAAPEISAEPEVTAAPTVKLKIFVSDESAEHFVEQTAEVTAIDENNVFAALQTVGVIPEDVELLSFTQNGSALTLDFNEAYASYIQTLGTSGEYMAIGCLVNTYLAAFGAETVTITVNGAPLESGHVIYDMPLQAYPDNVGA